MIKINEVSVVLFSVVLLLSISVISADGAYCRKIDRWNNSSAKALHNLWTMNEAEFMSHMLRGYAKGYLSGFGFSDSDAISKIHEAVSFSSSFLGDFYDGYSRVARSHFDKVLYKRQGTSGIYCSIFKSWEIGDLSRNDVRKKIKNAIGSSAALSWSYEKCSGFIFQTCENIYPVNQMLKGSLDEANPW